MRAFALALAWVAGGCIPKTAIVDGKEVPRLELELTGDPYHLFHKGAHPQPRGPSGGLRDDGGEISGRVCGMFAEFDVKHAGDRVELVGAFDGGEASHLEVRDANGAREIGGQLGNAAVDLKLTGTALTGHVGLRVYALEQDGDRLAGHVRLQKQVPGEEGPAIGDVELAGRDALWAMPPADQALVLASVLTCQMRAAERHMAAPDPLKIRFGGPPADRPAQTSSLYRRGL